MKVLILSALLAVFLTSTAQDIVTIQSAVAIQYATVGRAGDLYTIAENGNIMKYNGQGGLLATFHHTTSPALFDTGNGVRLLSYYRTAHEYFILNPSLILIEEDSLDPAFAIEPWFVCSSGDHNIWILDAADWSLKQIDTRQNSVLTEALIDTTALFKQSPRFTYMREYQHFLFVLEKETGILIFNSLGKHLRTIHAKNLVSFNFFGEELYFVQGNKLTFIDLFTLEERNVALKSSPRYTLVTEDKMFSVYKNKIEIQEYKP